MKEIEVKLDTSGKVDWDSFATLDDLVNDIIKPKVDFAKSYAHKFERNAMETALRENSRAVYVVEWTSGTGTRIDFCWKVFTYEARGLAFRLARDINGHVRVIDFKCIVDMSEDEFNAVPSPNRDLAEQIREKFKWLVNRNTDPRL